MEELKILLTRVEAMRAANKEVMTGTHDQQTEAWHDGVDATYGLVIDLIKIMMEGGGK